jgi:peroxiredoxin
MDVALLGSRLLLAGVFAVAGLAKLADRRGTREGIEAFGVHRTLARPAAILLPISEIAVAVALLPAASAWVGSVGALGLLGAFAAGIALNLARGRRPECHCFGQVYSRPIGRETLIRNGLLAGAAGFVAVQGPAGIGPGALDWAATLSATALLAVVAGLVLAAAIALQGWLLANILRQHGRLLLRVEQLEKRVSGAAPQAGTEDGEVAKEAPPGLPVGSPAPAFRLSGVFDETLTLDALRAPGKPLVLVFSDPGCGPCNALLPEIGRWQREHMTTVMIVPISRGTAEANRAKNAEHGVVHVLLQDDSEVADAYQVRGTPSAVLVNADGTVGSPLAEGADEIRALVARAAATPDDVAEGSNAEARTLPVVPAPAAAVSGNGSGNGQNSHVHDHDRDHDHAQPEVARVGDPAPSVRLPDLRGRTVNLAGMRGSRTVVLFWSTTCGFCDQILDDLKAWEADPPDGAPKLLVVSGGTRDANKAQGFRSPVVLDQGFSVGTAFGAQGTPTAVLVDAEGRIASELAVGGPAVLGLLGIRQQGAEQPSAATPTAQIGAAAPPVRLPDLAGKTVDLAEYRGRRTALLFWNPGCGFCQRMAEDLREWEAKRGEGVPELVVVSQGSVEANEAFGLRSPVLLDEGFRVASSFGANGTPMAVLIDRDARVASEVAGGADAVFRLLETAEAADASAKV